MHRNGDYYTTKEDPVFRTFVAKLFDAEYMSDDFFLPYTVEICAGTTVKLRKTPCHHNIQMSMDTQCVKCKDLNSDGGYFIFDVEGRLIIPAFGCELYGPLQATWQFMNGSPYHKISEADLAVVVEEEKRAERILKKKEAEDYWDRLEESVAYRATRLRTIS